MIGHNDPMIYRNCGIMLGDDLDGLANDFTQVRQWDIARAVNDRPYILPEEILLLFVQMVMKYALGVL